MNRKFQKTNIEFDLPEIIPLRSVYDYQFSIDIKKEHYIGIINPFDVCEDFKGIVKNRCSLNYSVLICFEL